MLRDDQIKEANVFMMKIYDLIKRKTITQEWYTANYPEIQQEIGGNRGRIYWAIRKLKEKGLIIVSQLESGNMVMTNSYKLNYEKE